MISSLLLISTMLVTADAAIPLQLRFIPGETTSYRWVQEKAIERADSRKPFHSTVAYTFRCQTISQGSTGEGTVRYTLDRLEWTVTGGASGPDGSFDSRTAPPANERPDFVALRGLIGKTFTATITPGGDVVDLHGVQSPTTTPQFADFLGEAQLQGLLRAQYAWLPDNPVNVGESWHRTETQSLGLIGIERSNTATLTTATANRAVISSRIAVAVAPPGPEEKPSIRASVASAEPGQATIVFNPSEGRLDSLEATISFQLTLEGPVEGKRRPQSIVQQLNARTSIERLSAPLQPTAN